MFCDSGKREFASILIKRPILGPSRITQRGYLRDLTGGTIMAMSQLLNEDVQLSLLATTGHAGLAAELLTERFGLTLEYAESVLDQGYGLLVARLAKAQARAALPLLAILGLRVAIQPCESLPPDEFGDVSIRIVEARNVGRLIHGLERLLGLTGLTAGSFCGPEGYVLADLSPARAEWLAHALRRISGVSVVMSEQQSARYDIFSEAELTEQECTAVRRHLRLLGCTIGGFGGAIGSGMDRRAVERVLARFPDLGLFGTNQAFQRHELLVIGRGTLTQQEFIDFLMTRPVAGAIPAKQLLNALPLRVEAFLTRSAARQFLADYSAIGMQAITRLVRRTDATVESP